jgi:hypothetical protein
MRNAYTILVRKPEGKRRHGKPRRRWKSNTEIDLGELGCQGADWIHLAHGSVQAVVNSGFQNRRGISWPAEQLSAVLSEAVFLS